MSQTLSSQAESDLISHTAARPGRVGQADVSEERLWGASLRYLQRFSASTKMLLEVLDRRLRLAVAAGLLTQEDAIKRRDAVVNRAVRCGYLDDSRFAQGRVASLLRRGKSPRLIVEILKNQGITKEIVASTLASVPEATTEDIAFLAAQAYAKRRRLGPFRKDLASPRQTEKDIAALLRAGHSFAAARRALATPEDEF